jgi:hypothetical protein
VVEVVGLVFVQVGVVAVAVPSQPFAVEIAAVAVVGEGKVGAGRTAAAVMGSGVVIRHTHPATRQRHDEGPMVEFLK